MNGQKWVKLWVDFLDNDKILSIFCAENESKTDGKSTEKCSVSDKKRDTILLIWVQILCLAGKVNKGGVLAVTDSIPYTPKLIAETLRRKLSDVKLALEIFNKYGMIEVVDGFIAVRNWSKYQGSEVEERKREYNRERMRGIRSTERQENDKQNDNEKTTVRQQLSLQKREEEYIKENTLSNERVQKKSGDVVAALDLASPREREGDKFVPPTYDQVADECSAHGYSVDPVRFVKYYNDRRWQGVTDWRARLKAWNGNGVNDKKRKTESRAESSFDITGYRERALRQAYGEAYGGDGGV